MRASILAPLALAALVTIGCRSGGNQELVERELRFQESELYRLHDQLDDAADRIDSLERENDSLRKELDGDSGGGKAAPARSSGDLKEPRIELPHGSGGSHNTAPRSRRPSDKAPPEVITPSVEPGIEMTPGEPALVPNSEAEEVPPAKPRRRSSFDAEEEVPPAKPRRRSSFDAEGASHNQPVDEAPVTDHRLASIVLNKRLTGGPGSAGNSGDSDVSVVLEPRNAAGQFVKATGEISIVVLDPAVTGPAARVARWDYKPNEVQAHLRSSDGARGYHFELHWPGRPPAHGSLELFVRLRTSDGQRFVANQPIQVDMARTVAGHRSGSVEDGQFAAGRSANTAHGAADDEAALQLAARDSQRPRMFSRIRGALGKAPSAPAPPESDGSLNISVPGTDGGSVPPASSGGAAGSAAPKSNRLIDRSKLMGGPGIIDGSRLRGLTGGNREDKAPPTSGGGTEAPAYRPGGAGGNRGGEAPPFQGSGGGQSYEGEAPRFSPAGSSQGRGPAIPNVEFPEPIGGPPPVDDGSAQSEEPMPVPPARTARPIWRPYR